MKKHGKTLYGIIKAKYMIIYHKNINKTIDMQHGILNELKIKR